MSQTDDKNAPGLKWIFVPFVITLAVTAIRLLGELNQWSRFWFNPEPGGGGAPIGISWLIPVFGFYFGYRLAKAGHLPPSAGRQILWSLGAIALMILAAAAGNALGLSMTMLEVLICAASLVGAYLACRPWRALGRIHFAYALAARIPVALLMLFAIYGDWGTHYDLAPAGFPDVGPLSKWLIIGLLPQMTVWIGFTIAVGGIFGVIGAKVGAAKGAPASVQSVDV
jgi:hypothetical protein